MEDSTPEGITALVRLHNDPPETDKVRRLRGTNDRSLELKWRHGNDWRDQLTSREVDAGQRSLEEVVPNEFHVTDNEVLETCFDHGGLGKVDLVEKHIADLRLVKEGILESSLSERNILEPRVAHVDANRLAGEELAALEKSATESAIGEIAVLETDVDKDRLLEMAVREATTLKTAGADFEGNQVFLAKRNVAAEDSGDRSILRPVFLRERREVLDGNQICGKFRVCDAHG